MADQLITRAELAGYLQLPDPGVDNATADIAINAATAHVQRAARQRLVAVTGDTIELEGTTSWRLHLPERPVTAVTSVTLDGVTVTDYTRLRSRLWRDSGWQRCGTWKPSTIVVIYDHGWQPGAQELQAARGYVFPLAGAVYNNPTLVEALAIDDYRESYGSAGSAIGLTRDQARELRRAYSTLVGSVPA